MRYENSLELRWNVWLDVWICDACEAQAHVPRRPGQTDRVTPICPNPDCVECPAAAASHWSREPAERAAAEATPGGALCTVVAPGGGTYSAHAARVEASRRKLVAPIDAGCTSCGVAAGEACITTKAAERAYDPEGDAELGDRQAGEAAAATATARSMLAGDPNERTSTVHPERAERAGELSRELSRAVDVLEVRCPRCGMPGQTLCTDSELEGASDG